MTQLGIRIEKGYDGTVTPPPPRATHGEGPVVTDDSWQAHLDALAKRPELADDNVRLSESSATGLSGLLVVIGLAGLALTLLGVFVHNPGHALAAFYVGTFTALACSLGALFMLMVFHALDAYWPTTLRRQFENIASMVWVPLVGMFIIVVVELAGRGVLMTWLDPKLDGTFLIDHKAGYLNGPFFLIRFFVYAGVWLFLARSLASMSREQDSTGDRRLSRKMRFRSTIGLLLFAMTVPFAAFDFLMSLDYRFFSTMWGVYYFGSCALAGVSLVAVVTASLRVFGRLTGVVTEEHFHDLGKLVFAFTVFWAYIAFSQFFLIWYSNIPEETMYFIYRRQGGIFDGNWMTLSALLVVAHFVVPFFLLITRKTKRSTLGLGAMAAFMLVVTVFDLVWIVRPMVYVAGAERGDPSPISWWLDVAAVVGVLGVFGGLLVRKIASGPLVPLRDPRLEQCLGHKNYV